MHARLDPVKLAKAATLVQSFEGRKKCTQRDLQSLVGFLNWAAKVVYGGRVFLRRLVTLCNSVALPGHHLRITADAGLDLLWWREEGLPRFNGAAMVVPPTPLPSCSFQCDACGAGGLGVFFEGGFASFTLAEAAALFPDAPPAGEHIAVYETYVVLVAVRLFPDVVAGCHLAVRSDTTETVAAINKFTARRPLVMQYVRELFSLSVSLSFRVSAVHLPGKENDLADALSRQDWPRFSELLRGWRAV